MNQQWTVTNRAIPASVNTGCPELDLVWQTYIPVICSRTLVQIPDTDDDLTWHAFLGHSIDMQGFRAAEFAGVDPLTRKAPAFVSLKQRNLGVPELARLWEISSVRHYLLTGTKGIPFQKTLDVLVADGGDVGKSLSEAFAAFPWRKFHWTVRALLQNSAALKEHDFSFRRWLQSECRDLGESTFPPPDFQRPSADDTTLELALRRRLQKSFYRVGPALAAYMICDWQLWLWFEGRTEVFANFKLDSFHEQFVKRYGGNLIPTNETGFCQWWLGVYPELPPRLANECIWLGMENRVV